MHPGASRTPSNLKDCLHCAQAYRRRGPCTRGIARGQHCVHRRAAATLRFTSCPRPTVCLTCSHHTGSHQIASPRPRNVCARIDNEPDNDHITAPQQRRSASYSTYPYESVIDSKRPRGRARRLTEPLGQGRARRRDLGRRHAAHGRGAVAVSGMRDPVAVTALMRRYRVHRLPPHDAFRSSAARRFILGHTRTNDHA